jgi:chromosome segregation ATPase
MKNTSEFIKHQYEQYDQEYWDMFNRVERAKKEYEQAKNTYETWQKDLDVIDNKRKEFEQMYNEIVELEKNQK